MYPKIEELNLMYRVTTFYLLMLKKMVTEAPSQEEEEVCMMLQDCLELRKKYVFREQVAPWHIETITDPSTPKPNPDPFHYEQEPASKVLLCFLCIFFSCYVVKY